MGWTGQRFNKYYDCKYRIIEDAIGVNSDDYSHEVAARGRVGNTFYYAIKYKPEDGKDFIGTDRDGYYTFGLVVLTSVRDGEFFYKMVSEDMGPYHCQAPKKVLKALSHTDSEYALRWREDCEEYHKELSRVNNLRKLGSKLLAVDDIEYSNSIVPKGAILEVVKYGRSKALKYGGYLYAPPKLRNYKNFKLLEV